MTRPTLTVVLTNYNHARYLPRSIGALLAQAVRPDEFIVVDDGSTDNSVEVIQSLQRQDPLVTLLRCDRNVGAVRAANCGLDRASGDLVFFAAADDHVLPGVFEEPLEMLRKHPQVGLCFWDPRTVEEDTGRAWIWHHGWSQSPFFLSPRALEERMRSGPSWINGAPPIYRRKTLEEAGGFLPSLEWYTDFFASHVIAFRTGACYLPRSYSVLTGRSGSYSSLGTRNLRRQRPVLRNLFRQLSRPAYGDVRGSFERSGIIRCLVNFSKIVRTTPELWDPRFLRLLRHTVSPSKLAEAWLKRHLPHSLYPPAKRIRDWIRRMRTGSESVAQDTVWHEELTAREERHM